jgi:hypothetical protein
MAKSRFIATILLPSPLACAHLTTADASNLLVLFTLSFAEAIITANVFRFTPGRWGSVIQGPCYASTNRRGRRMSYPAVCSKWVTLFGN